MVICNKLSVVCHSVIYGDQQTEESLGTYYGGDYNLPPLSKFQKPHIIMISSAKVLHNKLGRRMRYFNRIMVSATR